MGFVDLLRNMVYSDDLAKIAENKQELQELEGGVQEARTWVGHQREELTISLEGKEIKQVDGFVYLR